MTEVATAGKNLSEYNKEGIPNAEDFRFGIVVSEWNEKITGALSQGAVDAFLENNVSEENILCWNVPGSFELIYGCKKMQEIHKELDAIIAIGCVVQGETKHFDFVCEAVSHGVKDLNLQSDIPVVFCLLTDTNLQQSIDRSGGKHGNKGTEAAIAAIKMAQLRKTTG